MTANAKLLDAGPRAREGSPWTGLWAVVFKEMADYLTGTRMRILEILILLTAVGAVYGAMSQIRETIGRDPFLFLKLFTLGKSPIPSFVEFLSILVPLIAISLTFDAINGEFNRRTLSRVLAQPIYRDALLFGKFLAAFFTMALVLTVIWLLIIGLGLIGLGVPPSGQGMARLLVFLAATIFYGGVWLALAMLFSITFRQPATAAMASLAVWLFFLIFWNILAGLLANVISPVRLGLPQEIIAQARVQIALARFSPTFLYGEIMAAILNPAVKMVGLGLLLPIQPQGSIPGSPLPLSQSLLLVWPQFTGLIAATILLFALGYVLFQRQEIRA
ncbi:MAG TPA: ABC transporter permease [Anaerolineae bacterium]|nr:ABC transporter permease [Caldilineae bacterium]HID35179.1 ABC transporter permease [Anaerolineae bacterium]HIQ12117.1 ABC transporter permease [Caldilineales bacterium]